MTIAIDFGTSNTVVARWNAVTQQSEILSLPAISQVLGANPPLIPSLVYVESVANEHVLIGQAVRDRGLDQGADARFFRNFKRGIGTDIQGFLPELEGQAIRFEQVGQWFLERVIEQAMAAAGEASSLVMTVPVDSFEAYRHWLGDLCRGLAVEQVRLLDEPTAAALGYGLTGKRTLLVIDFGGGTLDFSLVQLQLPEDRKPLGFILKWGQASLAERSGQRVQVARVLAKAAENLGGADIDHWLADYFHTTQAVPLSPLTLRLVERLKIQLSTQEEAREAYFDDETLESYDLALTRSHLEQILHRQGFFQRLDERMNQVLQQARRQGIAPEDIEAVALVGGTAQMPAVQAWVQQYFDSERLRCERPFQAIAEGALQLYQGTKIEDFLYHSYGIRYWDRRQNRHGWHPIIKQGQAYPMEQPVELLLGASAEKQPSIELVLGELGDETPTMEVYFEQNRLVTRPIAGNSTNVQPLNDRNGRRTIARLEPPGVPGCDRIRVQFWVDADRRLCITVDDLLTHETLLRNQPVVQLR
ncbi:Chaperone protein dnaK3 [Halomicronema hongdechloris C2206]|uniref:Chaperone protein dnaK3 n=1 Tax=Halomicronema hongdechloris C2206 TaxID=1641165 RepID=A0A1Z3HTI7_9CYAN|nr:Hsp70 family protein [Halomicronema hongdechloris]ASC73437.1 Chaperone protein dnaK3 [Halomicronema hongdechloris C2206]